MIVLDTHVLVWWIGKPEKLSSKARNLIEKNIKSNEVLVSSISIWEIYLLVKKGKLKLTMDVDTWHERVEDLPFIQFIPVDNWIASKSVDLPELLHSDPADRIIIATALRFGAKLLTRDKRILDYSKIQTLKA